eukprot:1664893-Ditylum_brightwellii.AAC.1
MVGNPPEFQTVWCYPEGIANILSLASVKDKHQPTYDSENDNSFLVEQKDSTAVREFKQSKRELHYSVMDASKAILVNTVEENKNKYSLNDYSCAVEARQLYAIIGQLSLKT